MGKHFPIYPIKVNTVHAAEHLLHRPLFLEEFHLLGYEVWQKLANVLEEATSSVSIIKVEESTTSNVLVKKEGIINSYVYIVSQQR